MLKANESITVDSFAVSMNGESRNKTGRVSGENKTGVNGNLNSARAWGRAQLGDAMAANDHRNDGGLKSHSPDPRC